MPTLRDKIRGCWQGPVAWDCPMAEYTTFKVGGPADALIEPASREELAGLLAGLTEAQVPWLVVGGGSNILVADRGVAGVVIVLGRKFCELKQVEAEDGTCRVSATAGCALARLTSWSADLGLAGLEFAVGIPGSVGGAIFMNAGAWGGEIATVIREVELIDASGRFEARAVTDEDFCYRGWRRPLGKVIVSGTFALVAADRVGIIERCHRYARERAAKQPKNVASAGSFFKNPPGDAAGRLIERAGLKGERVGDAEVSPVHANFLVNRGKAAASDLHRLMRIVQERVKEQFGVTLEPEVKFIGRWQEMGR